jgi:Tol biopolymer transport system component
MIRPRLALATLAAIAATALGGTPAGATLPGPVGPIAFWDFGTGQVYTVFANGSDLRQLTHTDANHIARAPAWSPDGQWIIYTRLRINQPDDHARIWIMRSDGSDQHQLAFDRIGYRDYTGSFTPDGRWIVFSRCLPNDGVCSIARMRSDGTHRQQVTGFQTGRNEAVDFRPSVSSTGMIAFGRFFAAGIASQIYTMRPGGQPHPITPAWVEAADPDWAPNARTLDFNSNSQHNGASLFQVGAGGGDLTRLTTTRFPHNDFAVTHSPGGGRVAFVTDRPFSDFCCLALAVMPARGGAWHVVPTGNLQGTIDPAWGPSSAADAALGAAPARLLARTRHYRLPGLCQASGGRAPYC